ncbi:MAG: hypothetical protein GJ680_07265 [Alteromonadaceae bacterium]|nr:hypothetical protein [Alteromonadaceae bacterium]
MSANDKEVLAALVSLGIQKEYADINVSEYWIYKYCKNELNENEKQKVENLLAHSSEYYSLWLEVNEAIALTETQSKQSASDMTLLSRLRSCLDNVTGFDGISKLALGGASLMCVAIVTFQLIKPSMLKEDMGLPYPTANDVTQDTFKRFTGLQNKWPNALLDGVAFAVKAHAPTAPEWDRLLKMEIADCTEESCTAIETRQFSYGKMLAEMYISCASEKRLTTESYNNFRAMRNSNWWPKEYRGYLSSSNVCKEVVRIFSDVVVNLN